MGETTTQSDLEGMEIHSPPTIFTTKSAALPDGRHLQLPASKLRWELQSNHPHLPWFGKQLYQSRNWEIRLMVQKSGDFTHLGCRISESKWEIQYISTGERRISERSIVCIKMQVDLAASIMMKIF